jgi:hypothetical protein
MVQPSTLDQTSLSINNEGAAASALYGSRASNNADKPKGPRKRSSVSQYGITVGTIDKSTFVKQTGRLVRVAQSLKMKRWIIF